MSKKQTEVDWWLVGIAILFTVFVLYIYGTIAGLNASAIGEVYIEDLENIPSTLAVAIGESDAQWRTCEGCVRLRNDFLTINSLKKASISTHEWVKNAYNPLCGDCCFSLGDFVVLSPGEVFNVKDTNCVLDRRGQPLVPEDRTKDCVRKTSYSLSQHTLYCNVRGCTTKKPLEFDGCREILERAQSVVVGANLSAPVEAVLFSLLEFGPEGEEIWVYGECGDDICSGREGVVSCPVDCDKPRLGEPYTLGRVVQKNMRIHAQVVALNTREVPTVSDIFQEALEEPGVPITAKERAQEALAELQANYERWKAETSQ